MNVDLFHLYSAPVTGTATFCFRILVKGEFLQNEGHSQKTTALALDIFE